MPEIYHKRNYLFPVNADDVDICTENCDDYGAEIEEFVRLLISS